MKVGGEQKESLVVDSSWPDENPGPFLLLRPDCQGNGKEIASNLLVQRNNVQLK